VPDVPAALFATIERFEKVRAVDVCNPAPLVFDGEDEPIGAHVVDNHD
jgi:hypothetical protein